VVSPGCFLWFRICVFVFFPVDSLGPLCGHTVVQDIPYNSVGGRSNPPSFRHPLLQTSGQEDRFHCPQRECPQARRERFLREPADAENPVQLDGPHLCTHREDEDRACGGSRGPETNVTVIRFGINSSVPNKYLGPPEFGRQPGIRGEDKAILHSTIQKLEARGMRRPFCIACVSGGTQWSATIRDSGRSEHQ